MKHWEDRSEFKQLVKLLKSEHNGRKRHFLRIAAEDHIQHDWDEDAPQRRIAEEILREATNESFMKEDRGRLGRKLKVIRSLVNNFTVKRVATEISLEDLLEHAAKKKAKK